MNMKRSETIDALTFVRDAQWLGWSFARRGVTRLRVVPFPFTAPIPTDEITRLVHAHCPSIRRLEVQSCEV